MNTFIRRGAGNLSAIFGIGSALCLASTAQAAAVFVTGTGANSTALQTVFDQFATKLGGTNNGVGGSFPDGYRRLNWDGVPDNFSEPNFMPGDFFNVQSPRGVVFNPLLDDGGSAYADFRVSATAASGVGVRFSDLNPAYANQFTTFSAQRLFMPHAAHAVLAKFYKPGTTIPATVSGFGVVLVDVDSSLDALRSTLIAYGPDGKQLVALTVPALSSGLSFVGITFDAGERIDHVVIRSGTAALGGGVNDSASVDVVVMDDMIYGEPQPVGECSLLKDGFQCPAP
jgi:hypothetical protein